MLYEYHTRSSECFMLPESSGNNPIHSLVKVHFKPLTGEPVPLYRSNCTINTGEKQFPVGIKENNHERGNV